MFFKAVITKWESHKDSRGRVPKTDRDGRYFILNSNNISHLTEITGGCRFRFVDNTTDMRENYSNVESSTSFALFREYIEAKHSSKFITLTIFRENKTYRSTYDIQILTDDIAFASSYNFDVDNKCWVSYVGSSGRVIRALCDMSIDTLLALLATTSTTTVATTTEDAGGDADPDGSPSNLVLTVPSDTEIDGTFTEGSTNQDGFRVYISTDNITFTLKTTVLTGSFQATGLTAGTLYYFKLVAYKGSTESSAVYALELTTLTTVLTDSSRIGHYIPAYSNLTLNPATYAIAQINDLSGAGNHLTEATYPPFFNTKSIAFGRMGVRTNISKTGMTLNQPVVYYMVVRIQKLRTTGTNTFVDGDGVSNRSLLSYAYGTYPNSYLMTCGTVVEALITPVVGRPKIYRIIFNGENSFLKIMAESTSALNPGTHSPNAIRLGNTYTSGTTTYGQFYLYECAIRKDLLSETEIYNYLYNKFFAGRTWNVNWNGHSMMNSVEVGTDIALPDHTENWLKINHRILIFPPTNSAFAGATIANMVTYKPDHVTPYYDSTVGIKNIIPIFIGTNDVTSTPGTGASAFAALESYVDGLVTDGWIPVVITMCKATTNAQREIERNDYNNAIKAKGWQYILDVDTIPELSDPTDTTYYNADTVHLVNEGNLILGRYLAVKMAEII